MLLEAEASLERLLTIFNTQSAAGASSLRDQIANYTSSPHPHFQRSLGFIWIGENDLSEHTNELWQGDPHNTWFANNISSHIAAEVGTLLNTGMQDVFVANIYPKHIAPVTTKYLCGSNQGCVTTWGNVIQQANAAIESALTQFGNNVIHYDVFSFMVNLAENGASQDLTQPTQYYCDEDASDPNEKWNDCMVHGHASEYYKMSFVNLTTHVQQLIAQDMASAVENHFGM